MATVQRNEGWTWPRRRVVDDVPETALEDLSLEELFKCARELGRVHLHQHSDDTFSFSIDVDTGQRAIFGRSLELCSNYNHKTIASAIITALRKADAVRDRL